MRIQFNLWMRIQFNHEREINSIYKWEFNSIYEREFKSTLGAAFKSAFFKHWLISNIFVKSTFFFATFFNVDWPWTFPLGSCKITEKFVFLLSYYTYTRISLLSGQQPVLCNKFKLEGWDHMVDFVVLPFIGYKPKGIEYILEWNLNNPSV